MCKLVESLAYLSNTWIKTTWVSSTPGFLSLILVVLIMDLMSPQELSLSRLLLPAPFRKHQTSNVLTHVSLVTLAILRPQTLFHPTSELLQANHLGLRGPKSSDGCICPSNFWHTWSNYLLGCITWSNYLTYMFVKRYVCFPNLIAGFLNFKKREISIFWYFWNILLNTFAVKICSSSVCEYVTT